MPNKLPSFLSLTLNWRIYLSQYPRILDHRVQYTFVAQLKTTHFTQQMRHSHVADVAHLMRKQLIHFLRAAFVRQFELYLMNWISDVHRSGKKIAFPLCLDNLSEKYKLGAMHLGQHYQNICILLKKSHFRQLPQFEKIPFGASSPGKFQHCEEICKVNRQFT